MKQQDQSDPVFDWMGKKFYWNREETGLCAYCAFLTRAKLCEKSDAVVTCLNARKGAWAEVKV
jgi:hypothetical protein